MRNSQLRNSISRCFCHLGGTGLSSIGKNQGELLAPVARSPVGGTAATGLDRNRNLLQTIVAGPVTVVVVERFEGIDVAKDQRQRSLVPARDQNLLRKIGVEESPVGEIG